MLIKLVTTGNLGKDGGDLPLGKAISENMSFTFDSVERT